MSDEGIIKFESTWHRQPLETSEELHQLIDRRNSLKEMNLIGVTRDGFGYGNVSLRCAAGDGFLINGSQTGAIKLAGPEHFTLVSECDIENNRVTCAGPAEASSESMTHGMIYQIFPEAQAVIHVHHHEAWQRLKGKVPTTAAEIAYGTQAMASEVRHLAEKADLGQKGLLVMAGHEDGLITFGADLAVAFERVDLSVNA